MVTMATKWLSGSHGNCAVTIINPMHAILDWYFLTDRQVNFKWSENHGLKSAFTLRDYLNSSASY